MGRAVTAAVLAILLVWIGACSEKGRSIRSADSAPGSQGAGCGGGRECNGELPPYSLPDTHVTWLDSTAVGIRYKLYVSLPKGYAARTQRFPVVFLLDADYSFAIAHQIEEQLSDYRGFPELILIGIAYDHPPDVDREQSYRVNRTRDYTPVFSEEGYPKAVQKYSGGAEHFLEFIDKELIPYVDQNYRTVFGDRTLVGHSYGALFGTWAILAKPSLFRRAVLVSPSYWYADKWMFGYEAKRAKALRDLPMAVYLGVGTLEAGGRYDMLGNARRMVKILNGHRYPSLSIRLGVEGREHHYSMFPSGLSTGLRYVFGRL